ncbi:MAG: RNA polymerase sigma factor [Clostridia bacterium]|nr:RNA polymerase sigma factor [Clostridia bacterium]
MATDAAMLNCYRLYLDGDEAALGEIVKEYSDAMLFFTDSLVKNIQTAEEIVADAFVHIAVKKRAFRGESGLKTYLYAICRHRAVDYVRKRARQPLTPLDTIEQAADRETLESRVLRSERDARLHQAIEELNEDYRTVLYLVYFQNMSHDQAAQVMHKSRKQTENLIFRARQALRAILEKDGYGYEDL